MTVADSKPILYRCGGQEVPTGYRATQDAWDTDPENRATVPFTCPACGETHFWGRTDPDTVLGED